MRVPESRFRVNGIWVFLKVRFGFIFIFIFILFFWAWGLNVGGGGIDVGISMGQGAGHVASGVALHVALIYSKPPMRIWLAEIS